ncbi:hypothetical protein [Aeromonas veronii]
MTNNEQVMQPFWLTMKQRNQSTKRAIQHGKDKLRAAMRRRPH